MGGNYISDLQNELNTMGYQLKVDGKLGLKTYTALLNAIGQATSSQPAGTPGPVPPPTPASAPHMHVSEEGAAAIGQREGIRLKAYRDSVGVWTIGVGHTAAAGEPAPKAGMTITLEQAHEILRRDLADVEEAIDAHVDVPLEQHEFDALASIVFNIGAGNFASSTFLKRLNRGSSRASVAEAIMFWNKPKEIIGRRASEVHQFLGA